MGRWGPASLGMWMAAAATLGCGPRAGETATDTTVRTCGQEGPVELIPQLIPQQLIGFADDRLVVAGRPTEDGPLEVWAVGPCGDNPVRLTGETELGKVEIAEDVVYACDDTGRMTWLDPHGREASHPLFEHTSCRGARVEAGLVVRDPVRNEALLRRDPHDPTGAVVLLAANLRHVPWPRPPESPATETETDPVQVAADTVFVLDETWKASAIDPTTLETSIVAEAIQELRVDPTGRWLFVEDFAANDDEDLAPGATRTIDQRDGGEIHYEARGWPMYFAWPFAVWLHLDDDNRLGLVDLRSGLGSPIPIADSFLIRFPMERFVVRGYVEGDIAHYGWSPSRQQWQSLGTFAECAVAYQRNERYEVLERSDCGRTGTVQAIDFETGASELLATGVAAPFVVVDDQTVWTAGGDDDHGDLLVVDGPDAPRLRLARDAKLLDERLSAAMLVDGDVLYGVRDGQTGGLWRSALP